jgi:hypothetical protein
MAGPKKDADAGWDDPPVEPRRPHSDTSRPHLPGVDPKPEPPQSSLALLAKDLMPPPPPMAPTQIEINAASATNRQVPDPGLKIKTRDWLRRYAGKVRAMSRQHKMILLAGGGTLLVVIVLIIALAGGDDPAPPRGAKLAKQGQELLNSGNAKHAAELIESELVGKAQAGDGEAYMVLGHARFAMKRYLESLTAYERALTLSPKLASDTVLRANTAKVLDTKDSVAAVVALEILASRVQPPAHDVVVSYASTGKLPDARRRAFAIAEREGLADKIDKVESWSLDLANAGTCEDRRAFIAKLASTKDKRALPALKRAKLYKCAEKDAADAIAALEGS